MQHRNANNQEVGQLILFLYHRLLDIPVERVLRAYGLGLGPRVFQGRRSHEEVKQEKVERKKR